MSRRDGVAMKRQGAPQNRHAAPVRQRLVSARAAAHPLLRLQRLLGNRATNVLIQDRGRSTGTHEASGPARPMPRQTSIPDALMAGVESLSGEDLSDVRVHVDSDQPAKLNALAYARGNQIHLAPGQEHHLAHEAWHIVQQRQGRVQMTSRVGAVGINDDVSMETEADQMGARAATLGRAATTAVQPLPSAGSRGEPAGARRRHGADRPATDLAGTVIQMQRAPIVLQNTLIDLDKIEAFKAAVDAQLDELGSAEINAGFIDMANVQKWLRQYETAISELKAEGPGTQAFSLQSIMAANTVLLQKFKKAVTPVSNLRGVLNQSLINFQPIQAELASIEEERGKAMSDKAAAARPTIVDRPSEYVNQIDQYIENLEGAIILVEGHYVVVLERHQLKHNPDLGILIDGGGTYGGERGTLFVVKRNAWEDHRTIYAVEVLEWAKKTIANLGTATAWNGNKVHLDRIEAYVTITYKHPDWMISYHGNPPLGQEWKSKRSK